MHAKTYRSFIFLLFALTIHDTCAQVKSVGHTSQQWVQYYNLLKLSDRLTLMTDGGFRWSDGEKLLYIARTGIGYQLTAKFRVAAGIASTGMYCPGRLYKFKLRPYQEIFTTTTWDKVVIQQRFRLEERYFRGMVNGEFVSGHDFNFRLRYFIAAMIPLLKLSEYQIDQQLLLNVSNEIFINAGKDVVYNTFDRYRLIIGPVIQANKDFSVGLLYNFQFSQLNAPASYMHDSVLWLTVMHQMNLSKRNKT